jgi:hypothetical protein
MGTPNSHIGMPRNNGAYMSAQVPVSSESITLFSGQTLPFTGYFSPQPVSYFEDTFYRIYNSQSTKDSLLNIDAYVEHTDDFTPTGDDLDDDDAMTGAVWSASWLTNSDDIVKADLDGGINTFYLKDRTLQVAGATMTRMRLDFTTGCIIDGAMEVTCEFWAGANSAASAPNSTSALASNPYGNGTIINISRNSRRNDVSTDRKI